MNQQILRHRPVAVWTHFEQLNAVPRPSKQEGKIIAFMQQFGRQLGLETQTDPAGNVLIRKPATAGRENRPIVVLQGHLDMVHQKNADTEFDFSQQGIVSWIDEGWLKAKGTTLGADNGMGVASIMAVLSASDLQHGPIEALFTIDEETGMTGAFALEPNFLRGRILLNTDTEDEGELCIGCAGGIDTNVDWKYPISKPTDPTASFKLSVTGLRGGHSGCEIHLGRGNANKIMNRILSALQPYGLQIGSIDGGSLRNAIPRESFATAVFASENKDSLLDRFTEISRMIQAELSLADPDLKITAAVCEPIHQVIAAAAQQQLLDAIYAAPNGVVRMSDGVAGLVETSTSLARVQIGQGKGILQFLTRSSVDSAKLDVTQSIAATFRLIGADVVHQGAYPGWRPNPDSRILSLMQSLYQQLFQTEAKVSAVHAGLECGIIGAHYPDMDMISFGPTIKNPHSPDEKCEIASVEKYWQFLVATLAAI